MFICSYKAGVNPEQGFFTHEVYSDELFFKLARAAVDIIGKFKEYYTRQSLWFWGITWRLCLMFIFRFPNESVVGAIWRVYVLCLLAKI